jgi:ABC-type branched-subunit amino acid transport system substrate-binding protein
MSLCYHYSGSIDGTTAFYVDRDADEKLYAYLKAGQMCFVFNSRQMGKSSLRVHITQLLHAEGVRCAVINPQLSGNSLSEEQWYAGLISKLIKDLGLKREVSFGDWWHTPAIQVLSPVDRLGDFIDQILLHKITQPIVIFVEEVDHLLSLPFDTDGFFNLIRGLNEQRTTHPAYQRLTFCLLGVATPFDLIRDPHRTVFNIGESVELKPLTRQQAQPLSAGLEGHVGNPAAVLAAVLNWSGGQPFLTQKLLALISAKGVEGEPAQAVAEVVREQIVLNWEAQDVPYHLQEIRTCLLRGDERQQDRKLRIVLEMHKQGGIPLDSSRDQLELRLTGLVMSSDGRLRFYNPIYEQVFDRPWVEKQIQELQPRIFRETFRAWQAATLRDRRNYLLSGLPLEEGDQWAEGRNLTDEEALFLKESRLEEMNGQRKLVMICVAGLTVAFSSLGWGYSQWNQIQATQSRLDLESYCLNAAKQSRISCGESTLTPNPDDFPASKEEINGREFFKLRNYTDSVRQLEKALKNGFDPEIMVARNNAKVLAEPTGRKIYTLAVELPFTNSKSFLTKSLLAGVAEAQADFNAKDPNRRLFVVMADDQNESQRAKDIAAKLEAEPLILALVGTYSSQITLDLLQFLSGKNALGQKIELALLSATSTATVTAFQSGHGQPSGALDLGKFFRPVSTTDIGAESLVDYAKKRKPRLGKVLVFYDDDLFARSFSEDLKRHLRAASLVPESVKMNSDSDKSISTAEHEDKVSKQISAAIATFRAEQGQGSGTSVIALVPNAFRSKESRMAVHQILSENSDGKFLILGANTVYGPEVFKTDSNGLPSLLTVNEKARQNLVVNIPAYTTPVEQKYGKYWHYATAYDTTNLFLDAITHLLQHNAPVTRTNIQQELARGNKLYNGKTGSFRLRGSDRDPQVSILVRPECEKDGCYWSKILEFTHGPKHAKPF